MHFCMSRLRNLNSFQIFKTKVNRSIAVDVLFKAYSESNDTTLRLIQYGRTGPLTVKVTQLK
jgi:hypothetical protein